MLSRLLPLIAMLLLALAMTFALLKGNPLQDSPQGITGYRVGEFDVPDLNNRRFSPALWHGQVAMLNVFASWCVPCAMEQDAVAKIARSGKIKVYGLAWNDTAAHIEKWLKTRGDPYAAVGIDARGVSTVPLALTGVPETFVFDKRGNIAYHYKGALTGDMVGSVILPLAEKLNAE